MIIHFFDPRTESVPTPEGQFLRVARGMLPLELDADDLAPGTLNSILKQAGLKSSGQE